MNCDNYTNLTEWQYNELLQHIQDNQYYLGEKLGHFVDWKEAEHDFFEHYIITVGKELRLTYCNSNCTIPDCSLRIMFNNG